MNENKENIQEEIHQEFQIERMVLFSDAVFAIVITLMAIEIRIPEGLKLSTSDEFMHALGHLAPTIIAYIGTFIFIGAIWYQHLKIYGFIKTFDARLVFHNLLLLFFVGLFPFSASLISRGSHMTMLPFYIYIGIIFSCLGAVTLIEHYIFVTKPSLLNGKDYSEQLKKYSERKLSLIILAITLLVIVVFNTIFSGTIYESLSGALFALYPIAYLIVKKRRERKVKK